LLLCPALKVTVDDPVVQVLDVKKLPAGDHYRLVLSDGVNYMQSILSSQMAQLAKAGTIKQFGTLRLREFLRNNIAGRQYVPMCCHSYVIDR
jgi:replication factor A1